MRRTLRETSLLAPNVVKWLHIVTDSDTKPKWIYKGFAVNILICNCCHSFLTVM